MGFSPKKELIRFLQEDIGKGDITSNLLPKKRIKAKIISRENGIVAGVKFARDIFNLKNCSVKILKKDGSVNINEINLSQSENEGFKNSATVVKNYLKSF